MGPAVDRVGRGFPMVLAAAVPAADDLDRVIGAGSGWFAVLEQTWRAGGASVHASVDAFDAAVATIPAPLDWLSALPPAAAEAFAAEHADTDCVPWLQPGEDRQLAGLARMRAEVPDGCLWWTLGAARVPPGVRMTHGLPRPDSYAGFLVAGSTPVAMSMEPVPSAMPAAVASADVFADLLPDFEPDTAAVDAVATRPPVAAEQPTPATPVASHLPGAVCKRIGPSTLLLVADNGAPDPRRQAAAQVDAALSYSDAWTDADVLRERVLTLHPSLYARREDLIDPVPEDGAVAIACLATDRAHVLRVGAASAWHWRRGQLRPLFTPPAPMADDQADTVRPGDLLGAAAAELALGPGLGAASQPDCERVDCMIAAGDRLVLLVTDTLVRLPARTLAAALAEATGTQAENRIAAAAGLGMERARWPLAVIEVGT
jgi:hypothetical protein